MAAVAVQSINTDIRAVSATLKAREQEELVQRLEELEQLMAGIERRLEALEERAGQLRAFTSPPHYLIRHLLETIRVHKWGRSVYQATDRELNTVGMLVAANEFPYGVGVYTFPSGVTVTLTRTEDGESIQAEGSGRLEVEDLPEGLRPYFERMDPAKQPERERRLQELLGGGDGA